MVYKVGANMTYTPDTLSVKKGGTGQKSYTDGQLLIGKTVGNTLVKTNLSGTTNQLIVTNGSGTITLSLPQDIATISTPIFASETLNSGVGNTTFLAMFNGQSAAVSALNTGRLRYNTVTQTFQVSLNGAAYTDIITAAGGGVTGSGVSGRAAFWTGTSTLSSDTNFQWNNTTKQLLLGNGTIATPSLSFSSEPDLGIYRNAANTLGFLNNNNVRATLFSSAETEFALYTGAGSIGSIATSGTNFRLINSTTGNRIQIGNTTTVFGAGGTNDITFNSNSMIVQAIIGTAVFDMNGNDFVSAGRRVRRNATAASISIAVTDYLIGVTNTASPRTLTLPSAITAGVGRTFKIKDESGGAGTNNITVATVGGQTIDGAATFVINTNFGAVEIYSNGANWFVL